MGDCLLGWAVKRGLATAIAAVFLALGVSGRACADACVMDLWNNGDVQPRFIFPNWYRVWASSFDVWVCDGCTWVATENIIGLTVVNFGTLPAGDITNVYWVGHCGATTTGTLAMAFAGTYAEDGGSYPAWTWSGSSANFYACPDLCGTPPCGVTFTIDIYATIGPCPAQNATLSLGFPSNTLKNPLEPGSINDNAGCVVPWFNSLGPMHNVYWAYKDGPDVAAPGDTVDYTIYYGKPGAAGLNTVSIIDSQPAYTHYVGGSASPPPDSGWDPNIGPPLMLKWTTGPFGVTGGPTSKVGFSLTVDWGNGDNFEAGSGNVGAPEKARLGNRAAVYWPDSTCGQKYAITPQVTTVVRRFLFWKMADNDMLFAPSYGTPPDEITYSIFIKNMSDTKTWWDVHIWDTVPDKINAWCVNCGMEDPCVGWTMTPSGCAYAGAGLYVSGGKTIMTWKLDMPPKATLSLRWKGQVVPIASSGDTAINTMSLREYGRTRIVDGTGDSGRTVNFTHLAPIMLQTTYVSYVAFAGAAQTSTCSGYQISFNPLNRKTQFELRALFYTAGWVTGGGNSASIGTLAGNCIGGFPGGAGIPGTGQAGCKAERIPAQWFPDPGTVCTVPRHDIYKLTSNSPVLWQLLTYEQTNGSDNDTMAPATTLSYTGLMHYMWRRYYDATVGGNDGLSLISTAMDAYGGVDSTMPTTVHMFQYNYGSLDWDYRRSYELGGESQAYDFMGPAAEEGAWRTVSSDRQLVVNHGYNILSSLTVCCAWAGDNYCTYFPTRETGNVVSNVGSGTFYGIVQGTNIAGSKGALPDDTKICRVVIGNTGATDAKYEIWKYMPDSLLVVAPSCRLLNGTGGYWVQKAVDTVPAGLNAAMNPRIYNRDGGAFDDDSTGLYKVVLKSGGPIQVLGGVMVYGPHSGGSVMHAADGGQTGQEFWLHYTSGDWPGHSNYDCGRTNGMQDVEAVDFFCPKQGMAIREVSSGGLNVTYTTTGPDQCIYFNNVALVAQGARDNYRFNVIAGNSDAVGQFILCRYDQKGWTAPFLQTGVHYVIIMPPVVYVGQSFWITVVVADVGGDTKTDYAGTTSFSSTDPLAKIQGVGMDGYNYTWSAAGDKGVRIFINVSFQRLGIQTVVAIDTLDGSITGVGSTMVVGAEVKLTKQRKLTVAASGDTVQFQVCWENVASATAFSFVITDAVPMGTSYVPDVASTMLCWSNSPVPAVTVWYSTATTTTPPGTFTSVPGTGSPLSNSRWLRWTIRDVYVKSSGCVCYKVSVN